MFRDSVRNASNLIQKSKKTHRSESGPNLKPIQHKLKEALTGTFQLPRGLPQNTEILPRTSFDGIFDDLDQKVFEFAVTQGIKLIEQKDHRLWHNSTVYKYYIPTQLAITVTAPSYAPYILDSDNNKHYLPDELSVQFLQCIGIVQGVLNPRLP